MAFSVVLKGVGAGLLSMHLVQVSPPPVVQDANTDNAAIAVAVIMLFFKETWYIIMLISAGQIYMWVPVFLYVVLRIFFP